jgi:hypothetical protein
MDAFSNYSFVEVDVIGCSQMVGFRLSLSLQCVVSNAPWDPGDVTARLPMYTLPQKYRIL